MDRITDKKLRESLREAVMEVLKKDGPLATKQIYRRTQQLFPNLCDNEIDCRYCKAFHVYEPEWRHVLRWAQQDLKGSGEIERGGRKWLIRKKFTASPRV